VLWFHYPGRHPLIRGPVFPYLPLSSIDRFTALMPLKPHNLDFPLLSFDFPFSSLRPGPKFFCRELLTPPRPFRNHFLPTAIKPTLFCVYEMSRLGPTDHFAGPQSLPLPLSDPFAFRRISDMGSVRSIFQVQPGAPSLLRTPRRGLIPEDPNQFFLTQVFIPLLEALSVEWVRLSSHRSNKLAHRSPFSFFSNLASTHDFWDAPLLPEMRFGHDRGKRGPSRIRPRFSGTPFAVREFQFYLRLLEAALERSPTFYRSFFSPLLWRFCPFFGCLLQPRRVSGGRLRPHPLRFSISAFAIIVRSNPLG